MYADISWIGFTGKVLPQPVSRLFTVVTAARDAGVAYIADSLKNKSHVSGAEIDSHVRSFIIENGMAEGIFHRTGHAIDKTLHGWGVNIDGFEFPDNRFLLDGSCFSIEPGIYLDNILLQENGLSGLIQKAF